MESVKKFLKTEFKQWKPFEISWLVIATIVIVGLSIYSGDTIISFIASLTGVWCVILTGKGKRSSFIFGLINVILYAIVSYQARYYGEVMLNLIYFLPMNFVGFFVWKKHMNEETGEVIKLHLKFKNSLIIYITTAIAIVIYGYILSVMNGSLPYMDSMSTIISIVAQILSIKRLMEQWVLWIVVNIVTVIMWLVHYLKNGDSLCTLCMWAIYLINAIIMFIRWYKESKTNVQAKKEKESSQNIANINREDNNLEKSESSSSDNIEEIEITPDDNNNKKEKIVPVSEVDLSTPEIVVVDSAQITQTQDNINSNKNSL